MLRLFLLLVAALIVSASDDKSRERIVTRSDGAFVVDGRVESSTRVEGSEFWICVDYESGDRVPKNAAVYPIDQCGGNSIETSDGRRWWYAMRGEWIGDGRLEMSVHGSTVVYLSREYPAYDGHIYNYGTISANGHLTIRQTHGRTNEHKKRADIDMVDLQGHGSIHVRAVVGDTIRVRVGGVGFKLAHAIEVPADDQATSSMSAEDEELDITTQTPDSLDVTTTTIVNDVVSTDGTDEESETIESTIDVDNVNESKSEGIAAAPQIGIPIVIKEDDETVAPKIAVILSSTEIVEADDNDEAAVSAEHDDDNDDNRTNKVDDNQETIESSSSIATSESPKSTSRLRPFALINSVGLHRWIAQVNAPGDGASLALTGVNVKQNAKELIEEDIERATSYAIMIAFGILGLFTMIVLQRCYTFNREEALDMKPVIAVVPMKPQHRRPRLAPVQLVVPSPLPPTTLVAPMVVQPSTTTIGKEGALP